MTGQNKEFDSVTACAVQRQVHVGQAVPAWLRVRESGHAENTTQMPGCRACRIGEGEIMRGGQHEPGYIRLVQVISSWFGQLSTPCVLLATDPAVRAMYLKIAGDKSTDVLSSHA